MGTYTIKEPNAPASDKQVAYLSKLREDRDCPSAEEKYTVATLLGQFTKKIASDLIDEFLKAPKKSGLMPTVEVVQKTEAVEPVTASVDMSQIASGYYQGSTNGKVYFFDYVKKYSTKRRTLMRLSPTWDGKFRWVRVTSEVLIHGPWAEKANKLIADTLGEAALMDMETAGQLGKKFGVCIRCAKTLTDPVSVSQGLGPVCQKYPNWA